MPRRSLARLYRDEFSGYSPAKFQQDLLAGLTVAAVALPLALAFGVASGASAAAGLVTAILAASSWAPSPVRHFRSVDPRARCLRC